MSEIHCVNDDGSGGSSSRIGIMGIRSWIAQELAVALNKRIIVCPKDSVPNFVDYSKLDCLYLFAGRAKGSAEDLRKELDLISRLCKVDSQFWPRRLVYVSSRSAEDTSSEYGACKRRCELELGETYGEILRVIRPGAVFGDKQPIHSEMLIPSIARKGIFLQLGCPHTEAVYISSTELVSYMIEFSDLKWDGVLDPYFDNNSADDPWYIPGSFKITPNQLMSLWCTWEIYSSNMRQRKLT